MSVSARTVALALTCAGLAVAAMLALLQGDWSDYLIPLALWAGTVFLLALRWQTVAWLRGGRSAVVGRAVRTVALSCLGLFGLCTVAVIGVGRLGGCPIMGDPGGSIDFENADSVPLIVYPEGSQVPSLRRVLEPGGKLSWGYLVSCGSSRRDDEVFGVFGAEYAGTWVYCREVTRGEMDHRPNLVMRRGDLRCAPAYAPAGPP
jgi:hypothetical protein